MLDDYDNYDLDGQDQIFQFCFNCQTFSFIDGLTLIYNLTDILNDLDMTFVNCMTLTIKLTPLPKQIKVEQCPRHAVALVFVETVERVEGGTTRQTSGQLNLFY